MRLENFDLLQNTKIDSEREVIQSAMMVDSKHVSINEVLKKNVWLNAMKEELEAIKINKTWELIVLPKNKKSINGRHVFKIKLKPYGLVAKHKARLVAKGFLQKYALNYFEVFAPLDRHETIRLAIAITANMNLPLINLDVKSSFLNGSL